MYLLTVLITVASFAVTRGPDGRLVIALVAFGLIGITYVALAWITRNQPIWLHVLAHLVLFTAGAAVGMAPKPRLEEMAGMLYFLIPGLVIIMIALASLARLSARWL